MRPLLLLSVLLHVAGASAQTVLYRPLGIGDEWTYRHEAAYSFTTGTCPSLSLNGYVRARVLRDTTTLNGSPSRVVACTSYDPAGAVMSTGTWVAPFSFNYGETDLGGDACQRVLGWSAPTTSVTIPNPVLIGGAAYLMGSVALYTEAGGGPGGAGYSMVRWYGDRVGATSFVYQTNGRITFPSCRYELHTLQYAVVRGETFGVSPVEDEAEPENSAPPLLRIYPVPARTSVTVEVGEAATVEVVDALGRRVASGEAALGRPLRLDVAAWPPGVYVARTAGESGRRAVRIVVAR